MYEWSNWVFVCRLCNWIKSNQWLADGYVDPRAEWADERPERYFAFDTAAGALIPKGDHPAKQCQRAGLMTRNPHCLNKNVTEGKQFSQPISNCAGRHVRGLAIVVGVVCRQSFRRS